MEKCKVHAKKNCIYKQNLTLTFNSYIAIACSRPYTKKSEKWIYWHGFFNTSFYGVLRPSPLRCKIVNPFQGLQDTLGRNCNWFRSIVQCTLPFRELVQIWVLHNKSYAKRHYITRKVITLEFQIKVLLVIQALQSQIWIAVLFWYPSNNIVILKYYRKYLGIKVPQPKILNFQ